MLEIIKGKLQIKDTEPKPEWHRQLDKGELLVFTVELPSEGERLMFNSQVYGLPLDRRVTLFSDWPEEGGTIGWINNVLLSRIVLLLH